MDTNGEKYFSKTKTKIIHRRVIYKNFLKKLVRYDKEIYLIVLKSISILYRDFFLKPEYTVSEENSINYITANIYLL